MALFIAIKHISNMPEWLYTDVLAGGMVQIKISLKVKGVTAIFNFMQFKDNYILSCNQVQLQPPSGSRVRAWFQKPDPRMTVLAGGIATTSPTPASALRCVASSGVGMTLGLGAYLMKGVWFNSLHLLCKEQEQAENEWFVSR